MYMTSQSSLSELEDDSVSEGIGSIFLFFVFVFEVFSDANISKNLTLIGFLGISAIVLTLAIGSTG